MNVENRVNWFERRNITAASYTELTAKVLGRSLKARKVKKIVVWSGQRGYYTAADLDNIKSTFYILVNCQGHKREGRVGKVPRRMWGRNTRHLGECANCGALLEPSGNGLVVIEPESHLAVAEVVGNILYILFDISNGNGHLEAEDIYAIYEAILKEAASFLGRGLPTLETLVRGKYDADEIDGKVVDGNRLRKDILTLVTQATDLQKRWEGLKSQDGGQKVLDRIAKIPEIKKISVTREALVLTTHKMYGEHPSRRTLHEYGEFEIKITLGRGANVRFKNLTRSMSYYGEPYGHPHVQRGDPDYWCEGEGKGIIPLLRAYEIEAGILFALKAIDSVNEIDGGNYLAVLELFPRVTRREQYPAVPAEIKNGDEFGRLLEGNEGSEAGDLAGKIRATKKEIADLQVELFESTYIRRLKGGKLVRELLNTELKNVQAIKGVRSASVEENTLTVTLDPLVATENNGEARIMVGPLVIKFDFDSGAVQVKSTNPKRIGKGRVFHAPGIDDDGALPTGEISATLPELLGNLELEAAVSLVISLLSSFDSGTFAEGDIGTLRIDQRLVAA